MIKKEPTYSLLQSLFELRFITPKGIARWVSALSTEGTSLMALLHFSAKTYSEHTAIQFEGISISYRELYSKALALAHYLSHHHRIKEGCRVAMLCRNHIEAVLIMAAVSRLGAELYLFNSDMRPNQTSQLLKDPRKYQLVIADQELRQSCLPQELTSEIMTTEELRENIKCEKCKSPELPKVRRGGLISILSGGSSGHYSAASRRPSTTAFLPPFLALLRQIGIHRYQSVYIPLPFFHGFGLATLLISLVMGKFIWLTRRFDKEQVLVGIKKLQIEVIPIVPIMINRWLQDPNNADALQSVRCLISGGDRLSTSQVSLCQKYLPQARLYNLYGTSEAGFFLLATPEQMLGLDEVPIGRPIPGVRCRVEQPNDEGIGTLWVASRWAMQSMKGKWQNTGDLAFVDAEGRFFHRGRADRMVVCAGENVYLDHIEQVIEKHPHVMASRAYPVPNQRFGLVIEADIELKDGMSLTKNELLSFIKNDLTRAELPHEVHFISLKILSTGKRRSHLHS